MGGDPCGRPRPPLVPGFIKTYLRNGQIVVLAVVIIPGATLVEEGHVQAGGRRGNHCEACPRAGRCARHDRVGDAIPAIIAPVHGDARCARGQRAVVENLLVLS